MIAIDGCHVATVDTAHTEYATGHVVFDGSHITAVGAGPAPDLPGAERIDGAGLLVTPGLVNVHHHPTSGSPAATRPTTPSSAG